MNQFAVTLGMLDSEFHNPHGKWEAYGRAVGGLVVLDLRGLDENMLGLPEGTNTYGYREQKGVRSKDL